MPRINVGGGFRPMRPSRMGRSPVHIVHHGGFRPGRRMGYGSGGGCGCCGCCGCLVCILIIVVIIAVLAFSGLLSSWIS